MQQNGFKFQSQVNIPDQKRDQSQKSKGTTDLEQSMKGASTNFPKRTYCELRTNSVQGSYEFSRLFRTAVSLWPRRIPFIRNIFMSSQTALRIVEGSSM